VNQFATILTFPNHITILAVFSWTVSYIWKLRRSTKKQFDANPTMLPP